VLLCGVYELMTTAVMHRYIICLVLYEEIGVHRWTVCHFNVHVHV